MLSAHFAAYRRALSSCALRGCEDYARVCSTQRPDVYPNVYDYLSAALNALVAAVKADDSPTYRRWLPSHHKAMQLLFERMVSDILLDYRRVSPTNIYAMIQEEGWGWFKFCLRPIEVKLAQGEVKSTVMLIPSYTSAWDKYWKSSSVTTLDADEMSALSSLEEPALAQELLRHKASFPGTKAHNIRRSSSGGLACDYIPVAETNHGSIRDWALPIPI